LVLVGPGRPDGLVVAVDVGPVFTVVSSTQISAVAPAQPAGLHNVYVTGPAGTSAAVLGDLFTYR
ncbi:MAG: cell shape-determining protein, partial [Acidimicrobiales bacterium]